jgi:hypothetical protein
MRRPLFILFLTCGFPAALFSQISLTDSLLKAIHDRYDGGKKWYRYMTFSQRVEYFELKEGNEPRPEEIWHEAAAFPGKLLIKFFDKDNSDGLIIANDSMHRFEDGHIISRKPMTHPLLQLAFDLYFIPVDSTIARMRNWGIDVNTAGKAEWKGQQAWIIGAKSGDDTIPQVWYDAQGCFLRCVVQEGSNTVDIEFNDYLNIQGHQVASSVWFKANGVLTMVEYYYDIRLPDSLPEYYFDPLKFNETVLE